MKTGAPFICIVNISAKVKNGTPWKVRERFEESKNCKPVIYFESGVEMISKQMCVDIRSFGSKASDIFIACMGIKLS